MSTQQPATPETPLARAAHRATVLAAIVAIVALLVGLVQFTSTQELARQTLAHEREAKAVELFLKFNELKKSLAKEASANKEEQFWNNNMLLAITESVYKLTLPDAGWRLTVEWMLREQREFLRSEPQGCDTFLDSFVSLMKAAAPGMNCAK